MTYRHALVLVVFGFFNATNGWAQGPAPAQARLELTVIPAGATVFVEANETGESSFTNYETGGALTFNVNRYVALEGGVGSALGITQSLRVGGVRQSRRSPDLLHYTGNVVVYAPVRSSVVPFVTGGVGGVTVFERTALHISETRTYLAGNVGGGVKRYAGRWGLRADYRFLAVRSKDLVPPPDVRLRAPFFGRETRYAHSVFGGIVLAIR